MNFCVIFAFVRVYERVKLVFNIILYENFQINIIYTIYQIKSVFNDYNTSTILKVEVIDVLKSIQNLSFHQFLNQILTQL